MRLNSRNVCSVKRVMVSHQWLFGHLKSLACFFSRIFLMLNKCTAALVLLWPALQNAASKVFPVTLPFRDVSHVLFSFCPHSVFTTNFPLSVPSHTQFHSRVHSLNLRAVQTTTHVFITLWKRKKKKTDFLKKDKFHFLKDLTFSKRFSFVRSPHSCLLCLPS